MKKALFLFSAIVCFSCGKKEKIKAEKGGIDIVSNIYFNASKGLNDVKTIVVSKINYKHDTIVELVPDTDYPQFTDKVFVIADSLAFDITDSNPQQFIFANLHNIPSIPKAQKEQGATFKLEAIPHFDKRKNINDTILFKKQYKRFSINFDEYLTMYYVHPTDTLLPYTIYPEEGELYNGRVERVDMYNTKKDIFISIQFLTRHTWDNEAKNIFDFNEFIKKRK